VFSITSSALLCCDYYTSRINSNTTLPYKTYSLNFTFSFYNAGNVMVWDFTDTSFRPSIVLKAAHFKITSMEFLKSSSSSAKQQLLAAGDESGTLHIFEMPKSLVKPAHKEAIIMSAFLDREREVRHINQRLGALFLLCLHFVCTTCRT
jgi:hypothetical protein